MTETEKAWLACAIDGEGYIYLCNKIDEKTGWRIRKVNIGVCNTDLRFVREAARLLGNPHLYNHKPRVQIGDTTYAGKKPCYQARQVDRFKAAAILAEVRPYLIIKGEKADEAIAFVQTTDWSRQWSDERRKKDRVRMLAAWAAGTFTGSRGMKFARKKKAA